MQGFQLSIGKMIVLWEVHVTSSCITQSGSIIRSCLSAKIVSVLISTSKVANLMAGGTGIVEAESILPEA